MFWIVQNDTQNLHIFQKWLPSLYNVHYKICRLRHDLLNYHDHHDGKKLIIRKQEIFYKASTFHVEFRAQQYVPFLSVLQDSFRTWILSCFVCVCVLNICIECCGTWNTREEYQEFYFWILIRAWTDMIWILNATLSLSVMYHVGLLYTSHSFKNNFASLV